MNDKIPKKKLQAAKHEKPGKACALCKKFGGASRTHDTKDCRKWDQKGNLKKSFKGKSDETPPGASKSYAQLFADVEKLKASKKKLKKALKKKDKKRKPVDSSDSEYDSDSS